jgi:CBS domain containing-hemolysin-like protein
MTKEPSPSASWWRRALRVGLASFLLAIVVNYGSDLALGYVPAFIALLIVLLLVSIGILFDILGTSVTAADVPPLHAMAAKKVAGARQALWLVKNADMVANFANDVVGDVTGAVTGAAGATVALKLTLSFGGGDLLGQILHLSIIALIAGLTVGGKAAGKSFALEHATQVLFLAGRIIYGVEKITGRSFTGARGPNSSRRRTT